MATIATAEIKVKPNTEKLTATCRIIAKHLTALADELELQGRDEVEREP